LLGTSIFLIYFPPISKILPKNPVDPTFQILIELSALEYEPILFPSLSKQTQVTGPSCLSRTLHFAAILKS